jgi:nucleoside-diphosphate-sugar epimerase
MLVLVTGAAGFIGRHLVQRLIADGCCVRALSRREIPVSDQLLGNSQVEVVRGDLRNANSVREAARQCDVIYHLATARSGPGIGPSLWETNVEGTANIARAAVECQVKRVVFTSSTSVYGHMAARHNLDETSSPRPDSPYALSKLAAERILLEKRGLDAVIVRLGWVWGDGAVRSVDLFRSIASGRFRLWGSGKGLRTLMDPSEVVDGLVRAGNTEHIEGRLYLLTGREAVSLRELLDLMAQELGVPPPRATFAAAPLSAYAACDHLFYRVTSRRLSGSYRADLFLDDRSFNISKTRVELGWEPKFSTREIVKSTVSWIRREGLLSSASGPRAG